LVALLLFSLVPTTQGSEEGGIEITQILVSPNDADHNGTDWNGDGYIDKESDQYIMITNTGSEIVDISDWILDDITTGGSPSCRIGWNTSIAAGESITFYRSNTHIELDYWEGDTATLMNKEGELIDSMSYPGEDSWYGKVYTILENGTLWKDDPTPAARQGTCFTQSDNTESQYILKGRIVPMTSANAVIENGNMMIDSGKIVAIWADGEIPQINTDNITVQDKWLPRYHGL
jgi:hypothetical protein